jgi:hypothetical protein
VEIDQTCRSEIDIKEAKKEIPKGKSGHKTGFGLGPSGGLYLSAGIN